jgi:large subunit ribosomal protein L24
MAMRIKKKDLVMIIAGKERGSRAAKTKRGRVLEVFPEQNRVLVERLNMIKRHQRPTASFRQGGILEREGRIHASNVMVVCPDCDAPTRVATKVLPDGRKARACKKCNGLLDK